MRELTGQIFKSSALLTVGLMLGRISGYFREIAIAGVYSVSDTSDKILLILTVPDFINNLLSVTTVGAVILPLIVEEKNHIEYVVRYSIKKLLRLGLFLTLIFLIIISFIYDIKTFLFISISLVSVFPNLVLSVFVVVLNHRNMFFLPSLGTLIFNIVLIIVLICTRNLYLISAGVILAAVVRLLSVSLKGGMISLLLSKVKESNVLINISNKDLILSIVSNGILFINPLLDKVFASQLTSGSLTVLSYSEKIYLLPVSIYLTSMAVTSFPTFVALSSSGRYIEFRSLLKRILVVSLGLGVFTSVCFFFFYDYIVYVFFGSVGLSTENLKSIADVTFAYIPMLMFSGINAVVMNVLFSLNRFYVILVISLSLILMKFFLNYWMISANLDVVYIALGTSLMSFMQLLLGLAALAYLLKFVYDTKAN